VQSKQLTSTAMPTKEDTSATAAQQNEHSQEVHQQQGESPDSAPARQPKLMPAPLDLSAVEELGSPRAVRRGGGGGEDPFQAPHQALHTPHRVAYAGRGGFDDERGGRTRGGTLCETPHEIRRESTDSSSGGASVAIASDRDRWTELGE
jgi:hypothetical protein